MVEKIVTTTKTVTEIIGPCGDKRISGTSDDVLEVLITITYNFDGFSISATDVPARLDQGTGRYYLHGLVALRLNDKVNEIVETVRRQRQTEPETMKRETLLAFELKAPDFLSDAA